MPTTEASDSSLRSDDNHECLIMLCCARNDNHECLIILCCAQNDNLGIWKLITSPYRGSTGKPVSSSTIRILAWGGRSLFREMTWPFRHPNLFEEEHP